MHNWRNDKLRKFLTFGALSKECANMPDFCNVCASRMSPFPHPHTSGNMWTAKCTYVKNLLHPKKFNEILNKIYNFTTKLSCHGIGRYTVEHWIYSNPDALPCDLSNSNFLWEYNGVPDTPFDIDLQPAPRYSFPTYEKRRVCPTPSLNLRLK